MGLGRLGFFQLASLTKHANGAFIVEKLKYLSVLGAGMIIFLARLALHYLIAAISRNLFIQMEAA